MLNPNRSSSRFRTGTALAAGTILLAGCSNEAAAFVDRCEPYAVFSQNRFQPYGTAVRTGPSTLDPKSKEIAFAPNEVIAVDGWTRTGVAAYPSNPEPINSETNNDVWFHLANADAFVSFAGVRGGPTVNDPTSMSPDLGMPLAELKPECEYQIDK